jgi:cold shock CspA family protein
MTSLNDFRNMYWSIIEKKKILEKELQIKDNMLERLHDTIEELNKEIYNLKINKIDNTETIELQKKLDIYEKKVLYGTIKIIIEHKGFGYITGDDYGDVYFHVSDFCKGELDHRFVNMVVEYQLVITKRGYRAVNVKI